MNAERAAGLEIVVLRVFFIAVGLVYIGAAATGNAGGVLVSSLTALFGVAQIATGVMLSERRRWTYRVALFLVATGVVGDIVVLRVPGLVVYAVFLVVLLAPANRRRWLPSTQAA